METEEEYGLANQKSPSTVELMAVKNHKKSYTSPIVRNNDIAESHVRTPDVEVVAGDISKHRAYFMVFVLLFINLLNYMDRFTIAGLFPNLHVSSFLTLQYL
eukprot:XP_019922634.1 PREDICTED: protein spinster homolog 3-like [Crassostrea gigas]